MLSEKQDTSEPVAVPVLIGSRRRFFEWVTGAAAGIIGLSLAIPLVDDPHHLARWLIAKTAATESTLSGGRALLRWTI